MAIKGVIFDSDGVLVNTEELCARAEAKILIERGMDCTFETRLPHITGISLADHKIILAEDFRRATGRAMPDDVMPAIMEEYQRLEDSTPLEVPGVREVIEMLSHHRVPMAIGSNSRPQSLQRKLEKARLYEMFTAGSVHGFAPDRRPKPHPDVYIAAARSIKLPPEDCAVIDDSPVGVRAGARAGSYVVGYAGLSHIVRDQHSALYRAGADEVVAHMDILKKRLIQLLFAPS